jgi:hypothetical protein
MSRRRSAAIIVAAGLALALIPSLHCPDRKVSVVDPSGRPIPAVLVRLSYTNYSAEDSDHQVDRMTNESGQAAFQKRTLHASLLRWAYYTLLSARAGVHASFGPSATVTAFRDGIVGYDVDPKTDILVFWQGQPNQMVSNIVMEPVSTP